MKTQAITCEMRFEDFCSSLQELQEVIEEVKLKGTNPKLEKHLHRSFEVTHELAMSTMTEYFRAQGRPPYSGSRDVTLDAFNEELIDDGKGWLDMIICRIKATPVYTENADETLTHNILKNYINLFESFETRFKNVLNV